MLSMVATSNNYRTLRAYDLNRVVAALPQPVYDLLQKRPLYLAGGFIRQIVGMESKKTDIDLFGMDPDTARAYAEELADLYVTGITAGMEIQETANAITLSPDPLDTEIAHLSPVQLIHYWQPDSPEAILEHFDFTVCAAAVWWDATTQGWRSMIHGDFYADLSNHRLIYIGSDQPGGSLLRAFKYAHKGYHIQADSIAEIVEDIFYQLARVQSSSEMPPVSVIDLLREVDPLNEQAVLRDALIDSLEENLEQKGS